MRAERRDDKQTVYWVLCVLASAVALFPLGCDYIMEGGIVAEWLARVAEMAEGFRRGEFCLFPSLEARMASGIAENVQIGTFLAALLCFKRVLGQERVGMSVCIGVVLYMTNPYRIYICYDVANLSQATAWMLLPIYVWAVYGLFVSGGRRQRAVCWPFRGCFGWEDISSQMNLRSGRYRCR